MFCNVLYGILITLNYREIEFCLNNFSKFSKESFSAQHFNFLVICAYLKKFIYFFVCSFCLQFIRQLICKNIFFYYIPLFLIYFFLKWKILSLFVYLRFPRSVSVCVCSQACVKVFIYVCFCVCV